MIIGFWVLLPGLPLLRLDGSASGAFLGILRRHAKPGLMTEAFDQWVLQADSFLALRSLGAVYLLVAVMGFLALAYPAQAVASRRRMPAALLLLPALAWTNFAVMAVGLAMDDRGVGTPEELLHRPFVLAYFITVAWVGGVVGRLALGEAGAPSRPRQVALAAAAALLLAVPARLGEGVQELYRLQLAYLVAPTGLVRSAEFVRGRSAPGDLHQDSANDGWGLVTALSERRPYVMDHQVKVGPEPAEIRRRLGQVARFEAAGDEELLHGLALQLGIRWFILAPGDRVAWPASVVGRPAFEAGGYRVFKLF